MSFPAHAHHTFQKNKDKLFYLTKHIVNKLKKLTSPIQRARLAHKETQKYIDEITNDPLVQKYISCKKGCNACCHGQVAITSDEAFLLADLVKKGKKIDFDKLKQQANQGNKYIDWYKLDYKYRSCVFLDIGGSCTIYEDRPLVCRTNMVVSDPENCDSAYGETKPVRLIHTDKPNMIIMGAYMVAEKSGTLANLLYEQIKSESRIQRKPKKSLIPFAKSIQDFFPNDF